MRRYVLAAILRREWREVLRNRLLLSTIILPPIILVALPVLVTHFAPSRALPPEILNSIVASRPDWADMTPAELTSALVLQQFLVVFLIMPGYIPLSIATYSIVGEKQSRSLEAVLSTPIRTIELLTGKAIAALVPGIVASWLAYLVLVVLAGITVSPRIAVVFADPSWLVAVFVLGPAFGLVSVVAGLIVSSRVNDPRSAQQIGALVILPVVAIVVLQTATGRIISATEYFLIAVVVFAVGMAALRFAARLFARESILTRWR
jgi:ABC-2 type transport system permease protein